MGSAEETTRAAAAAEKLSKTEAASTSPAAASSQEPLSLAQTQAFAEWTASVQAYYGSAAAAAVAAPLPYVWGTQHLMSPYGTPIAYSPMYPHGALYSYPSMAVGMAYPTSEPSNGKNKGSASKGSSENAGCSPGKSGDDDKVTSGSAENATRSGNSGSEGSSDTRDDNTEPRDLSASKKRKYGNVIAEGETSQLTTAAQHGGTIAEPSCSSRARSATKLPVSAPGRTALTSPPTNLNIGMDLWNTSHTGAVPVRHRTTEAGIATVTGRQKGVTAEQQWIRDEWELKRERRKQSNRESARRSRLRKQQECEELARKVAELTSERCALTVELENIMKCCRDLKAENESLEARFSGAGIFPALGIKVESSAVASVGRGGSDHVHQSPIDSNQNNGKCYAGIDNGGEFKSFVPQPSSWT